MPHPRDAGDIEHTTEPRFEEFFEVAMTRERYTFRPPTSRRAAAIILATFVLRPMGRFALIVPFGANSVNAIPGGRSINNDVSETDVYYLATVTRAVTRSLN